MNKFKQYLVQLEDTLLDGMQKIERNNKGFLILMSGNIVKGTLTDGDIRRAILSGVPLSSQCKVFKKKSFQYLKSDSNFEEIVKKFESKKIRFLPIVNEKMELMNVLIKDQFHELLLTANRLNLRDDFEKYDNNYSHEIIVRPWGFYKTIFLSDFVQAKMLHIFPNQQLSLQYHLKREEHWIVVKGIGTMTLAQSTKEVSEGQYLYIPKGCEHTIKNDSSEHTLIISEVQLGTYFGEDDIIRVSDLYGRN